LFNRLPMLLAALLAAVPAVAAEGRHPPLVTPAFLPFETSEASDYRPVLDAEATVVIFERTFRADPKITKLYRASPTGKTASVFANIVSTRPDWCWQRMGGSLKSGPVAFSNGNGIYRANGDGSGRTLLPNTAGMVYPSWYPDCKSIAVDVIGDHVTARINATTGKAITSPLADDSVWAGFPSVNQANPRLVAFAGQFNRRANYYNEDLNYTWVTDRATLPPEVAPMDREAPIRAGFLQKFQARAGWWSPDGEWFAFESNRVCDEIDGQTYAIFIQDSAGLRPARQVTSCDWNSQHPKWFPPGTTGGKTMLIAAIAKPGMNEPFHIATLDVSAFVKKR
jgi:hypothetical protein